LWIIHRYQSSTLGSDVKRFDRCHQKLIKMGVSLKLLTDSDLLKEDLEGVFNLPISVLPIHYIEPIHAKSFKPTDTITCWWPGVIREGKGLQIIRDLAASSHPKNKQIHLVVNKTSDLKLHNESPKVTLVENHLSREDYLKWMQRSDIILLPYLDPHYEKATSSIFIEAIMAGKIPLVYPKTWMAYELKKHSLEELVIDWEITSLPDKIVQVTSDMHVLEKLQRIKKSYQSFHCLEKYASSLKSFLE